MSDTHGSHLCFYWVEQFLAREDNIRVVVAIIESDPVTLRHPRLIQCQCAEFVRICPSTHDFGQKDYEFLLIVLAYV